MLQKNNNIRLQNKITIIIIVVATISILFVNMESNLIKIHAQEGVSSSSIELIAKLVDNQYKWVGANNSTNPTVNITSGVDNQILIKSIEGDPEEHELIIEGISAAGDEREELIASDHVEDGSATTVNFNLSDIETSNYQSLEYYCEYHPDTMRGKVQIN